MLVAPAAAATWSHQDMSSGLFGTNGMAKNVTAYGLLITAHGERARETPAESSALAFSLDY